MRELLQNRTVPKHQLLFDLAAAHGESFQIDTVNLRVSDRYTIIKSWQKINFNG